MSPVAIRLVVAPLILLVVAGVLWLSHTMDSLVPTSNPSVRSVVEHERNGTAMQKKNNNQNL